MSRPALLLNLLHVNLASLNDASEESKACFLDAFDFLGEPFLLALDGIDRSMYTRIIPLAHHDSVQVKTSIEKMQRAKQHSVPIYLAFSSSTQGRYYEVRLQSWNCTCAQFTCGMHTTSDTCHERIRLVHSQTTTPDFWGGVYARQGSIIYYCKHLIAAFLLEHGGQVFSSQLKFDTVENFDFTL